MNTNEKETSTNNITITGPVSGQVAIGNRNQQWLQPVPGPALSEAERTTLLQLIEALKAEVQQKAPDDKKEAALERVDELQEGITSGELHLGTFEYIQRWFVKNLPGLAGAVTSVILHPIVGKLVAAAGDTFVDEFQRRFGPG